MTGAQSVDPQPDARIELLLIVGVVIGVFLNLTLSVGMRVMDRVDAEVAGMTVGMDFWQGLPEDVHLLDRQIERQAALFDSIVKLHQDELEPPDDGSRTVEEQKHINDLVEVALTEPRRVLRVMQKARRVRIEELKTAYLARAGDS